MPNVRFHATKGEASDKSIEYCTEFKNQTGNWPTLVADDQGREFFRFIKCVDDNETGIQFRKSPARTPQPNGRIEGLQFHLVQIARVMMIDAGLPEYLWPFAIETACYIVARLVKPKQERAPIQQWHEEFRIPNPVPNLEHLRVWGCRTYMHIPEEDRVTARKMLPKAEIGRLVGYVGDHGHVSKVWLPATGDVKFSRDVTFWEGPEDGMIDEIEDPTPPTTRPEMSKLLTIIFHKEPADESKKDLKRISVADPNPTIEDILNAHSYDFTENAYISGRVDTLSTTLERNAGQDFERNSEQEKFFDADLEGTIDALTKENLEVIQKRISQQEALISEERQIMDTQQALIDGIQKLEGIHKSIEHDDDVERTIDVTAAPPKTKEIEGGGLHQNITTRVSSRKNKGMRTTPTFMEEQEREQDQRRSKKQQKTAPMYSTYSTPIVATQPTLDTNLQASAIPDTIPKLKKGSYYTFERPRDAQITVPRFMEKGHGGSSEEATSK